MNLYEYINCESPVVFVMIGVPGSGKSTFAQSLKSHHIKVFSSDEYREKLFGDANIQTNPKLVFDTMYGDAIRAIKDGNSIVIDSTNVKSRDRKNIIKKFTNYTHSIIAICMTTPISECVVRDNNRDRTVGKEVIDHMNDVYTKPTIEEGFVDIFDI